MKKILLGLMILMCGNAWGSSLLQNLSTNGAPSGTDYLYEVASTTDYKITLTSVVNYVQSQLLGTLTNTDLCTSNGTIVICNTTAASLTVGTAGAVTGETFPASGLIVGTTDTQALTHKTLTDASNSFPTFNQSTSGSAASLSISGQSGLLTFTGLASTNRIKTIRDAADTILELGGSYTPTGTYTNMTFVTPVLGTPQSVTLNNTSDIIGGVTMTLGSDANYDTYYRNSSGVLTRLANGTTGQVLTATTSAAPSWGAAGGGSMTWPSGAGIAVYSGSSTWSTSLTAPTGTVVGTTDTMTLTNKRITPRVYSIASNTSLTPEIATYDVFVETALAGALTINNHSTSTPTDGEKMTIRLLDNGTAMAISWGNEYKERGVALPTTTVLSKYITIGLIWNATASSWDCVAVAQEY